MTPDTIITLAAVTVEMGILGALYWIWRIAHRRRP